MAPTAGLLSGVRVIESSMLGPAEMGGLLADLGAEVIKVEPPGGDYGRQMTWPIVRLHDGGGGAEASLLSLHVNRGKRSIVLDLRQQEAVEAYLDLVKQADVVIEAMRPGALARRGLGVDRLHATNPRVVFCSISGYGATGPYRDMPSHGIAYDTWAGQVPVGINDDGYPYIEEHTSIGIHAGPVYGALAILAAVIRARSSGEGCALELAQADAAAYFDWYRIESWQSYERPEQDVYGNPSDGGERRPPGTGGMKDAVRYQVYESGDGCVLFMASEQEFWKNFCEAVGRPDLFERWPGEKYGDHARGNADLRRELASIFKEHPSSYWIDLGLHHNTPIAPVNTPDSVRRDPQFKARLPWIPKERLEADMLPYPIRVDEGLLAPPNRAPGAGEHAVQILREVAGYGQARIDALRASGAVG